ncbi:hypothetical protein JCM6882_009253 [Rhodosporidiobolus microsporus]
MTQHPHPQPFAPSHSTIPPPESLSTPSALASLLSHTAPLQDRLDDAQRASPNPAIREAAQQQQYSGAGEGTAQGEQGQGEGEEEGVRDWGRGRVGEDGLVDKEGGQGREIASGPPTDPGFPIPSGSSPLSSLSPSSHDSSRAGPLQPEDHQPNVSAGAGGRPQVGQASFGGLGSRGEGGR